MDHNEKNSFDKKITLKELFSSPLFYFSLFPHIFALFLILSNNLGYFFAFFIFYLELVVDVFIVSFSILFIKTEKVKEMYKSNWPKIFLALRSLLIGLFLCLFFGLFAIVFIFNSEAVSIKDLLFNKIVLLAVGVYVAGKLFNIVINLLKNKSEFYIRDLLVKSLSVNLVTLILFIVPGLHILLFLNLFIENIQVVAIVLLFTIKAYTDSAGVVVVNLNKNSKI